MNTKLALCRPSVRAAAVLASLLWLGGCREEAKEKPAEPVPAAPASEAPSGAPSADLPLRRPGGIENRLLPPGAVIGADPNPSAAPLTFQVREEPARLLDWFRATGNGADFALESEMQEGAEYVLSGRVRATGEAYSVRIAPTPGGGTTGTILVAPR